MTTLGGLCSVQSVPVCWGNQAGRQWREELSLKLVRRRRSCWRRAGGGVVAGAACVEGGARCSDGVGVGEDIDRVEGWNVVRVW